MCCSRPGSYGWSCSSRSRSTTWRGSHSSRERSSRAITSRGTSRPIRDAISNYDTQFIRSFVYAGVSTTIALVIAYPLAYAIAFRAGKWKNALLLMVIVPFFVTYLIRTLSWETILDDNGIVVERPAGGRGPR